MTTTHSAHGAPRAVPVADKPRRVAICSCGEVVPTEPAPLTRGEELDDIIDRMDAAYVAWVAADWPLEGPELDAREAVYADLSAWTARASH